MLSAERARPTDSRKLHCVFVNHTHWDREWYRTFEAFRARLVDTIDQVLDLMHAHSDFKFLFDGQTILLEDYVQIRPHRRAELEGVVRSGRGAIGPWYVQPDGFIPSGESMVRNLSEGRRAGSEFGPVSTIGYVPDTFGHASQLPMILNGFGIDSFVFRRGLGDEFDAAGSEFRWTGPDGSEVLAIHLPMGYGCASFLPADSQKAAGFLAAVVEYLGSRSTGDAVLLMHGCDHTFPDTDVSAVISSLAELTGNSVFQGHLDDIVDAYRPALEQLPVITGELRGSRNDKILLGVLSTRTPLKVRNAECERALQMWAEPLAALSSITGGPDERPSLRLAWRSLLPNHAHDSICGCSADKVHEQMAARFDAAEELANETAQRAAARIAGADTQRTAVWDGGMDIAVFNPNPFTASGLVSYTFDAFPPYRIWWESVDDLREVGEDPAIGEPQRSDGFDVISDGTRSPARRVDRLNTGGRFLLNPEEADVSVEFVAKDLPPLGWKTFRIEPAPGRRDEIDSENVITNGDLTVTADPGGTLTLEYGGRSWSGLCGFEDLGDRGDSYDFSPVLPRNERPESVDIKRIVSCDGVQRLVIASTIVLPASLSEERARRSSDLVEARLQVVVRVAPGINRAELFVRFDNRAMDHRFRLKFPTGVPGAPSLAGSPLDLVERPSLFEQKANWHQPPVPTFPIHGGVTAKGAGLAVLTEGLCEGELNENGELFVTLVRSVGWLARMDLETRQGCTGPAVAVPGAQSLGIIKARLALAPISEEAEMPRLANEWRAGLLAVPANGSPRLEEGVAVLEAGPAPLVMSALKPAEEGKGVVLRMQNPSSDPVIARVRPNWKFSTVQLARLDETPLETLTHADSLIDFPVKGRSVSTIIIR